MVKSRRAAVSVVFAALLGHSIIVSAAVDRSAEQPHETQSAQCTITAGDVQASAQATISKRLDGVCGSVQLARSFELLEARLIQELLDIRRILLPPNAYPQAHLNGPQNLANYMQFVPFSQPAVETDPPPPSQPPSPSPTATPSPVKMSTKSLTSFTNQTASSTETTSRPATTTTTSTTPTPPAIPTSTERTIHFRPVQLKSLSAQPVTALKRRRTRPRELEVAKFNNTLLRGDEIRIFSYYWRIEDFQHKLATNVSQIDSPVFAISGLRLRVRAILNHLNRDYLYLQLQSVPAVWHAKPGAVDGDNADDDDDDSNVVLESGTMFREIETREFFRHKIVILDQETPTKDLVSQEFANTQSGFPVPNSAIVSGPYAKDSTILIKVVIYL